MHFEPWTHHGKVTLPLHTTLAITKGAGTLQAVATAFAAIEWDMIVGPGDAACKAGANVLAQLFDSQHVVHVNFQWAAHEIRQRGRQSQVVVTAREKEEKGICSRWATDYK